MHTYFCGGGAKQVMQMSVNCARFKNYQRQVFDTKYFILLIYELGFYYNSKTYAPEDDILMLILNKFSLQIKTLEQ